MSDLQRTTQLDLLHDGQNELGEGVLWCERSGRVFWTDIHGKRLHAHDPLKGDHVDWTLPERLCCFAFTADQNVLLAGFESRLAWLDLTTGKVTTICTVEADLPTTRLNDGRCDRQGRFVFGTLDEASPRRAIASFYRLNHDLRLERLPLPNIAISNSICFSPDGGAMYFCDSMEGVIYRWDGYASAADSSAAADIGVFADLRGSGGSPDGAIVDADGYLWNAQWGASRVARYAPDGSLERVLHLPVTQPSCLCLGGANLNDLFVTTAQELLTPEALAAQPLAGGLFHLHVSDGRGLPEVRFGGAVPAGAPAAPATL
jgi:L-arabinonolactonase